MNFKDKKIAIIGLGYVGLPLAVEFAKLYKVLGFDIDKKRIDDLDKGEDKTKEVNINDLLLVKKGCEKTGLSFSSNVEDLKNYNIYVVTVPTPINQFKAPDLTPLIKASEMIAKFLKRNDIVIYESTVYPGCTEEDCVPVLEKYSKLVLNLSIKFGGSSIRDFKNAKGISGLFQNNFKVYDRENKNCVRKNCKGKIIKIFISNRSSFFCKFCQK